MTQNTDRVEMDGAPSVPTPEEVLGKVRTLVGALLNASAEAPQISYALAYVATELGLVAAATPVQVFPIVLSAVSRAAADYKESGEAQVSSTDTSTSEAERPEGSTLH